ncbi:hypothetical protein PMAYCL1PPCAC_11293 [Pristionchus mayeri]|uniref:AAA+ ATPase domain-containing protein n=1 Tax=Pristionchus mayeri TaxID=1317129 RepID=A0AAN4ZMB4_9BILA|nr:hypothetical protein PMAYCL1PPCAC_11293 [Pristionchus mayeri]
MDGLVVDGVRLPWVEKYRPQTLNDVYSHEEITKTLKKWIETNQLPHMLFYGPPGTGKTTSILAVARALYSDKQRNSMVLELNASDDRGINVVREEIVTFAGTKGLHSFGGNAVANDSKTSVKLVILDECDAMTKDAQSALRRVIEKYTENVRFCIICNYLSNIIPAIQSRCTRFRFAPLDPQLVAPRIDYVVEQEKFTMTEDGKTALLELSGGDMRRVLNVLQAASMAFPVVDSSAVYSCVGQPTPNEMERLKLILIKCTLADACAQIEKDYIEKGYALADIVTRLHDLVYQNKFTDKDLSTIVVALAATEKRLAAGCSDKLQTAGLVAVIIAVRERFIARNNITVMVEQHWPA